MIRFLRYGLFIILLTIVGVSTGMAQTYAPTVQSLTFAQLPYPVNGTEFYCSNCVLGPVCLAGGPGAVARAQGSSWTCGLPGVSNSSLSGSQFQLMTFTATNVASGNSSILTDASNDLLLPTTKFEIGTGLDSGASGFALQVRDPDGDLNFGVPTFRSTTTNTVTALDVSPNGTSSDQGWGNAWEDICNTDLQNGGSGNFTCLHLGARSSGEVDIGENQYGSASVGPVVIVGGSGSGSSATQLAAFGTAGFGFVGALNFETIYAATGTPVPAASSSHHYRVCVSDSTACTNNSTYTSGGSTACELWSNGTNWIESGSGC